MLARRNAWRVCTAGNQRPCINHICHQFICCSKLTFSWFDSPLLYSNLRFSFNKLEFIISSSTSATRKIESVAYKLVSFILKGMTSVLPSHHYKWSTGFHENYPKDKHIKMSAQCSTRSRLYLSSFDAVFIQSTRKRRYIFCRALESNTNSDGSEDDDENQESSGNESDKVDNEFIRENLERMIGANDSSFNGLDLATLIRNKYGRSYDVQLIKKEFMGKNLLALNVMWKYMEQRSFPLTEEEYILRLDDVANTLRCWGAVSHIRNSLAKSRERPRIGKAVSIFIDMDESGGRANEWIYK